MKTRVCLNFFVNDCWGTFPDCLKSAIVTPKQVKKTVDQQVCPPLLSKV